MKVYLTQNIIRFRCDGVLLLLEHKIKLQQFLIFIRAAHFSNWSTNYSLRLIYKAHGKCPTLQASPSTYVSTVNTAFFFTEILSYACRFIVVRPLYTFVPFKIESKRLFEIENHGVVKLGIRVSPKLKWSAIDCVGCGVKYWTDSAG